MMTCCCLPNNDAQQQDLTHLWALATVIKAHWGSLELNVRPEFWKVFGRFQAWRSQNGVRLGEDDVSDDPRPENTR